MVCYDARAGGPPTPYKGFIESGYLGGAMIVPVLPYLDEKQDSRRRVMVLPAGGLPPVESCGPLRIPTKPML